MEARIVRIADTLSLADLEASEALWPEARSHPSLEAAGEPRDIAFDGNGNLVPDSLR
jgi:hypothetical protein